MFRILLQSTKPTSTDSPARVTSLLFYSFIISTLVGLFLWWISNSDRNPTGNNFPLLFNNADLFMDWLIPFQWSQIDHPWRYFGSIYQNKLPPSFYGPATIYFLKAFAYSIRNLPHHYIIALNQVLYAIIVTLFLFINALIYKTIYRTTNSLGSVSLPIKPPNLFLIPLGILASYPVVYSINRGSTSILSALFISLYLLCLLTDHHLFKQYILGLLITSQFQMIILLPLMLTRGVSLTHRCISLLLVFLSYLIVVFSTGLPDLISTYNYNKSIFKGITYMSHDLVNALYVLRTSYFLHLTTLSVVVLLLLYASVISLTNNYPVVLSLFSLPSLKLPPHIESESILSFILISSSCIFFSPSYNYHLSKIIPFILILLSIPRFRSNTLALFSIGFLFSYIQLWGIGSSETTVVLRLLAIAYITFMALRLASLSRIYPLFSHIKLR